MRVAVLDDRVDVRGAGDIWLAADPFAMVRADVIGRTSPQRDGLVVTGRGGIGFVTVATPADLWFFGDTGHASSILLRAHTALDDGRLLTTRLGRGAVHASAEVQHWWRAPWSVRIGAAAFADTARFTRMRDADSRADLDVGLGVRLAIPGLAGALRIDAAHGIRDGSDALSFAYEPW